MCYWSPLGANCLPLSPKASIKIERACNLQPHLASLPPAVRFRQENTSDSHKGGVWGQFHVILTFWQIQQRYGTLSGLKSWERAPRQCLEFRPWDCLERGWEPISLQTVTFFMHSANKDLKGSPPSAILHVSTRLYSYRTPLISTHLLCEVLLTKTLSYLVFKWW